MEMPPKYMKKGTAQRRWKYSTDSNVGKFAKSGIFYPYVSDEWVCI